MTVHECLTMLWGAYRPYAESGLVYGLFVFAVYYIWPGKDRDWRLGKALWMGIWMGLGWPPMVLLAGFLLR